MVKFRSQDVSPEDKETYLSLMQKHDSGEWFAFQKKFLLIMSVNEAVFICYLINIRRVVDREMRNRGWFYRKVEDMIRDIYTTHKKQERMVKSLVEKGYLKVERRGIPCKRWFFVDHLKLEADANRAVEEWESEQANSKDD